LPTAFSQCVPAFYDWQRIAVGLGSVWVPDCGSNRLLRVNPETGAIEATFAGISRKSSIEPESIVAFDASAAWIVRDTAAGTITRLDPATNKATPFVTLGKRITNIVADGSAVWASNSDSISRIDVTTRAIETTAVSPALGSIATVGNSVAGWLGGDQGPGTILVAAGAEVTNSFPVAAGATHVVVERGGLLWAVSDHYTVVAIDIQQRAVVASVPVDDGDGGIAAAGNGVWVGLVNAKQLVEVVPR
jgi:virginiamycin B lyase